MQCCMLSGSHFGETISRGFAEGIRGFTEGILTINHGHSGQYSLSHYNSTLDISSMVACCQHIITVEPRYALQVWFDRK